MVFLEEESNKIDRILYFYDKLMMGDIVYKSELAQQFDVHERTIRRDVQDIRYYLARFYTKRDIIYDPVQKGYKMVDSGTEHLQLGEFVALSKVILNSKILTEEEVQKLFGRLESRFRKTKPRWFEHYVQHELLNYKPEPQTTHIFNLLDTAIEAIYQKRMLHLTWNQDGKQIQKKVCPVGLVYKNSTFFLAILTEQDVHLKNELKPIPVILQKNLVIKLDTMRFTLAASFSFDEENFKELCVPPLQDDS